MDTTAVPTPPTMSQQRFVHSVSRVCHHCERHDHASSHSSPHSGTLPSPPDSPSLDPYADLDLDSISSFPSGSSSVFFSSSPGSLHSQPRLQEHEHDSGLIIPSLTLPSALHQPTPYGQTLGELSILLVGPSGAGKTALAEFLADTDDIVDATEWEDVEGGRSLCLSTDWIEEHDPHGLERFEGAENVTFTELDGFDSVENSECVTNRILKTIHDEFRDVRKQVDNTQSSPLLHSLLASSNTPLYTALIYVTATPLTIQDREIISALSSSIPVILFCTTSLSTALAPFSADSGPPPKLASFQPQSQLSLRTGLFRSPQTLVALRSEAADRFMRWREVERTMEEFVPSVRTSEKYNPRFVAGNRRGTVTQYSMDTGRIERWSKSAWEAMLSEDVARRLAESKSKSDPASESLENSVLFGGAPCFAPTLDPLHFRSLFLLSVSLLSPYSSSTRQHSKSAMTLDGTHTTVRPSLSRSRTDLRSVKDNEKPGVRDSDSWRFWRWGIALFCAGVGIGCVLSAIA